jgi:hypothetical protein
MGRRPGRLRISAHGWIERADIADFLEAVVSLGREDSIFARLAEAIGGSELEHAADVEAWQTAQGKQHEEL